MAVEEFCSAGGLFVGVPFFEAAVGFEVEVAAKSAMLLVLLLFD